MAELAVDLRREDYVAFSLHVADQPALRRRRLWQAGAIVLAAVAAPWISLGILEAVLDGGAVWPSRRMIGIALPISAGLGLLGIGWMLGLRALTRWSLRRSLGRFYAGAAEALLGPKRVAAREDGLHIADAMGDSRIAWPRFTALHETPELLVLMQGPTQGALVPRRGVPDADWAGFLAEVSARTGLPITPARG